MYHVLARWPYNVCISLEKRGRYSYARGEGRGDGCSQSSSVKDYYMLEVTESHSFPIFLSGYAPI